jgi:hypothetical protein
MANLGRKSGYFADTKNGTGYGSVNMKKLKSRKVELRVTCKSIAQKSSRDRTGKHKASSKDINVKEVFDGSWPDSDTINFVQNGLSDAGR